MLIIIISCILISLLFAPVGCLLLWQRQAYFADGLAHASLLAGSISLALSFPPLITAPIIAAIFAALVFVVKSRLTSNSAINIVSSSMLAFGILISSIYPGNINISNLLLGDILSVTSSDLIVLFTTLLLTMALIYWKFESIILLSLNSDLAESRGIKTKKLEFVFLVLLSLVLAVSMKIIGVLLSSALLMIPAASGYLISRTPIEMIKLSTFISLVSSLLGLIISFYFDLPTAPCIILSASAIHCGIRFLK